MLKNPEEQSRYELAEFEKSLKNLDNPDLMDEGYARSTEEFRVFKQDIKALQPKRHEIIREYFMKWRNQRGKVTALLEHIEESEEYTKYVLQEEYVSYVDAIPEIKEYLANTTPSTRVLPEATPV